MGERWVLARPRVASELADMGNWRIAVVCAPVGFGKRTALLDWAHGRELEGSTVAWIDAEYEPDLMKAVKEACSPEGSYIVIVMRFESVTDASIARNLVSLGLKAPAGSCLVLVSTVVPRFGEIGLVPYMNCAVFAKETFLFDEGEIERAYDDLGAPDDERHTDYLMGYCGGWPFFVYAALAPRSAKLSERRRDEQRAAYLENVVGSLDVPLREPLNSICFLDAMRVDLCAAMLHERSGEVDGQQLIEALDRSGLVEPEGRDWWRLFPPLREYLVGRINGKATFDLRLRIRKAYEWYVSKNMREESARQMVLMVDMADPLSITRELLPGSVRLEDGLFQKLASRPLAWLPTSPNACIAITLAYLFAGDGASALYWTQKLKAACDMLEIGQERDAFSACVPYMEQKAYCHLGESVKSVAIGESLLAEADAPSAMAEAFVRHALGEAYEQLGRLEDAHLQYERALVLAMGSQSSMLLAYVFYDLVWILFRMGRMSEADAKCREALVSCPEELPVYAGLRYFLEFMSIERGEYVDLSGLDERYAGLVSVVNNSDLFVDLSIVHARAAFMRGDARKALAIIAGVLSEVKGLAVARGAMISALAERVMLSLARESVSEAKAACAHMAHVVREESKMLRLPLALSQGRIALRENDLGAARDAAELVLEESRNMGARHFELHGLILQACVAAQAGDGLETSRSLLEALRCCRETSSVYPFLGYRRLLRPHLFALVSSRKLNYADLKHAKRILVVFDRMGAGESNEQGEEGLGILTRKEREVLMLLSLGYSREEMASTLVVSVNTVKTHLTQIYAKLGVHNRRDALKEARSLGILAD